LTRGGTIFGPHIVREKLNTREYLRIVQYSGQQVGAPAHTSNDTLCYLCGRFSGCVMSKGAFHALPIWQFVIFSINWNKDSGKHATILIVNSFKTHARKCIAVGGNSFPNE